MAFGRGAKLEVVVAGDTRQLDRALIRSEARLKKFGKNVSGAGLGGGAVAGFASKSGAVAGVAALGLGFRSMINAAKDSQVVLGQTSVAVKQAGLSWERYAAHVDASATRISQSSAFDDEDVLRSFQVFVRGQKDVEKSLELAALAADVARGRYTDLDSATQLVNKAAVGQVGALRRVGINIDKNATATQALTALTAAYGGAAKQYAASAAGSQDKLRVSLENLQETLAGGVLPYFTELVTQASDAVTVIDRLAASFDRLNVGLPGGGSVGGAIKGSLFLGPNALKKLFGSESGGKGASIMQLEAAFAAAFGLDALTASGTKGKPKPFKVGEAGGATTGVPTSLANKTLDARLSGNNAAIKAALAAEAAWIRKELKSTLSADEGPLKQALLGVTDEIKAMDDEMIAGAKAKKQAAEDAKARLREANRRVAEAFKDQAADIKSAVLDKLSLRESKLDVSRGLEDANKAMRTARMIGAPSGIQAATRQLEDARLAGDRLKWEQTKFSVGAGPPGPKSSLTAGAITIVINGAANPETIATQVIAAISKRSKQTAGQSRGRSSGNPMHR